jgi:AcrR family transcriptional regulator
VNKLIHNNQIIDKKKEIQIKRMMQYFIDATVEIIEEEDIDKITIRKIADKAGYNSATIYNYFQEVSHLIFFAAMTFLKKYTDALPHYIAKGKTSLDKLLLIWQCFCEFSFKEPKIYHAVFASDLGQVPEDLVKKYYTIFPDDIQNLPDELLPMVLESNLTKRGRIALQKCVEEGYIKEENAEEINEMCILIWHGMLTLIINNRRNFTAEEAVNITMKYIRQIILNATHFDFQSNS